MVGHHKKTFKYASKPFVLRGMIKCADCGCTITPETSKGHIYYSCINYKGYHKKESILEKKN
ncbi:MAG: zinc ribbon domain-containing protein [Minisyncoccales bacterium]